MGSMKLLINEERGEKLVAVLLTAFFLLFYVCFQTQTIFGGDAGDLVTASYVRGIPHPPGYPLYTFMGWWLTKIPVSTVAWRVSLLSSVPMAMVWGIFFLILRKLKIEVWSCLITTFALGFSYLFWLYALVPEVFALHLFFSSVIFYLLLNYYQTGRLKFLYWSMFFFGLSLTHHHTILFLLCQITRIFNGVNEVID